MTEGAVLELARGAVVTGLTVCAPALAAGLLVGVLISILLAATQIQEFTLTFVPKLAAMAAAGVLTAPWALRTLVGFTSWVFRQMATAGN
ncbi:MAG TPA: flagellar biosynthetic protein FliQ [Armatimonadota bacterium]|nr:flagellar biosynthetic protein FliQ [Armatimonadota bacterium]